jgi:hypothetical protein
MAISNSKSIHPSNEEALHDSRNLAGQQLAAPLLETIAPDGVDRLDLTTPNRRLSEEFFSSEQTLAKAEEQTREIYTQFKHFLSGPDTARRLRLQFDPPALPLGGTRWLSLDLNLVEQRARDAGTAALELPEDYFDRVLCTGIEAISRPSALIADIFRIVKPGGLIWFQTPPPRLFVIGKNAPRPTYWCITPLGLRLLLQNFQEVTSSVLLDPESRLQGTSFYFGTKRTF